MTDARIDQTHESKTTVFISYSRKDITFADRLEVALKARGFDPLIDRTEIYAFEKWWERIEALIARADTVVFVLSPDAVASEVALREVAFAASLNKRFAPVVWRRVDDKLVPEALAKLNFIFFDDAPLFAQRADQLAEALRTDIGWIRQHTEFGEAARLKGITFLATATRSAAFSHPVLLTGMLRNLIRNAIDYTPPGGAVFVTARRCGSELRIEVRDTGAGIPASALPAIFRAFQRADESRPDGLGLGLFIVKRAADLLGHRVEVRSTEGRGSCFTIVANAAR